MENYGKVLVYWSLPEASFHQKKLPWEDDTFDLVDKKTLWTLLFRPVKSSCCSKNELQRHHWHLSDWFDVEHQDWHSNNGYQSTTHHDLCLSIFNHIDGSVRSFLKYIIYRHFSSSENTFDDHWVVPARIQLSVNGSTALARCSSNSIIRFSELYRLYVHLQRDHSHLLDLEGWQRT